MSIADAVRNNANASTAHGTWVLVKVDKGNLVLKGTGSGVSSLRDAFGDAEVNFALLTLRVELQGIKDQPRHIWFHWKGPNTRYCLTTIRFLGLVLLTPTHLKRYGQGTRKPEDPGSFERACS